jgi:hypothetical protein
MSTRKKVMRLHCLVKMAPGKKKEWGHYVQHSTICSIGHAEIQGQQHLKACLVSTVAHPDINPNTAGTQKNNPTPR